MEPLLILTGVAAIFYSINSISRQPKPVNREQQLAWQADLHYETAVERIKEDIREDKQALRGRKAKLQLGTAYDVHAHLQSLENNLKWLESVRGTYQNLLETFSSDIKLQHKLLKDWQQFTDALWQVSNTDEWQQVYTDHGLPVDEDMTETAQTYTLQAEKVANRLFSRVHHA